jgi:predicted aspartyl protease
LCGVVAFAPSGARGAGPASVRDLLARYQRAIADPSASPVTQLDTYGTLSGAGLSGAFHTWKAGDRERADENLGPRSERTLQLAGRVWFADADGDVREFTGVLARRARTQRLIDSGAFASMPERCIFRGRSVISGNEVDALDVTAENGETETLYLDARTGLPDRIAYDDDDGRSSIDFSDWRTVGGHRFSFRNVVSDGDHEFDTVQTTTAVDLTKPIDPAVFGPFEPRYIDMSGAQTVPLDVRDGHLFASVRIAGRSYTFLVDTGAQNILVDKHVAAELGLTAIGALEASGAARTGGLQIVQIPELDIGAGRLHDLVATTIDLGASTSGAFRIDGILGYPFFASALVRIDPSQRTMTFGPPDSFAPSGEKINVEMDRAFPEADLRIDDSTLGHFIIDTGSAAELLLYRPFVEKHPGIVPFTQHARHSFGIGGSTPSYRSTLDQLSFGTVPLYQVDTDVMMATRGAFADRFDAGNVGLGILRNFVVTFDEPHDAIYVERGADFDDGRTRV